MQLESQCSTSLRLEGVGLRLLTTEVTSLESSNAESNSILGMVRVLRGATLVFETTNFTSTLVSDSIIKYRTVA